MTRLSTVCASRLLGAALIALAVTLVTPLAALAEPIVPVVATIPVPDLGAVETTIGASNASLTPDTFAIPLGRPYRFTARVKVPKGADSVQMRFQLLSPTGRLMIQKTFIQSNIETQQATAIFERTTDDLDLTAGSYPVRLEVSVADGGAVSGETIESELLVYDAKRRTVPVVFAVRISGQPLSDPQGRFVADPARFTRARDDARALAMWVTANSGAHATVGISPLLLDEWKRISQGYVLTGPEGDVTVPANDPVPLAYAETLDRINDAIQTGRFEMALTGYTDPDLSELTRNGLAEDIEPQYAQGLSAMFTSLGSTSATGTLVAGGCVPPQTVKDLDAANVSYAVVDSDCTRSGDATASSGVYGVRDEPLIVLVADRRAARATSRGDLEALVRRVFERRQAGSTAPVVVRTEVGPGRLTVQQLIAAATVLENQPWVRLALGNEVAAKRPKKTVVLRESSPGGPSAPTGYWDSVRDGRDWAAALAAALPNSPSAITAGRDSLIAQCSAWEGPDGTWASADRGRAFADQAVTLAKQVFEPIQLDAATVTLAGSSGEVPVTISNDSDLALTLVLRAEPSGGLQVTGDRSTTIQVLPKDNLVEIPVEMENALTGRLTVKLLSGNTVIDEQSVRVTASYLDRLVMIGGVVVVLGIMLAFVIRRVRAAERSEEGPTGEEE